MKIPKELPGLAIQAPISRLILDATKSVETRTYPLSKKYLGKPMALIETPGPSRSFKARVIGIVIFARCFAYKNREEFYSDFSRHQVEPTSPWAWSARKPKWGWEISHIEPITPPRELQKRPGIIYTASVKI